jgi:secreted trypsin-like serine protease
VRDVAEVFTMPGYTDATKGKDSALLRLAQPLDQSGENAKPNQLDTLADAAAGMTKPGVMATATGWGTLTAGGDTPDVLQAVDIPLVSNEAAQAAYTSETITDDQMAAGVMGTGGKDTCQGDSGGPLVVPAGNGTFKIAGTTSWGQGCADAQFPGMYGRVSSFDSWIESTMAGGGGGGGGG